VAAFPVRTVFEDRHGVWRHEAFREIATVLRDRPTIILIAAAVAAGLAIGFAGSTLAYRYKLIHLPGANLVERMNQSLNLDPSQREQIVEVMEDTRDQVTQLKHSLQRQRRRLMLAAYLKIRAILNPDQQKKFDDEFVPPKFRAEARQFDQHRDAAPAQPSPAATSSSAP
jgi:Spy/CpxP family protein refolding chaperone